MCNVRAVLAGSSQAGALNNVMVDSHSPLCADF